MSTDTLVNEIHVTLIKNGCSAEDVQALTQDLAAVTERMFVSELLLKLTHDQMSEIEKTFASRGSGNSEIAKMNEYIASIMPENEIKALHESVRQRVLSEYLQSMSSR